MVKNPLASAGDARDASLIHGLGRSPGGGNDNPLQYSCQENPKDRGAWRTIVHRLAESRTGLKVTQHACTFQLSTQFKNPLYKNSGK